MSSPQGKDKDYQRLKPPYPNVAVTPEKSSSTKLRKRKSEIQMDEFNELTPLKNAVIVTEEVDDKLKGLVGMDVTFLRSNGQEDTGKVKRVYKNGGITMTTVVYTNENDIVLKKELGLGGLMPLNMEILKDFMEFTPSSQRLEDDNGDDFFDAPLTAFKPKISKKLTFESEDKSINVHVDQSMYEFVDCYFTNRKAVLQSLIIFAGEEKEKCYHYLPKIEQGKTIYICRGCRYRAQGSKFLNATIEEENGLQYIRLLRTSHICQCYSYTSLMQEIDGNMRTIVKKPDYEFIQQSNGHTHIFVYSKFDEEEHIYEGYKYFNKQGYFSCCTCNVVAKELTIDGELVLECAKHKCAPRNIHTELVVQAPNFVKKNNGHVFVFSGEGALGNEYNQSETSAIFYYCVNYAQTGCPSRLKLMKNGEDEYLKLSINKHNCLPIQYIPDIDKVVFPPIQCPSDDEGIAELVAYKERLQKVHGKIEGLVLAWCYIIIIAGPDTPIEERYSSAAYIGYSTDIKKRLPKHWSKKGVVHKLMKKYGVVYLVPIFEGNCASCYDIEATGIELKEQGTLEFPFWNILEGEWKSEEMKRICKDRDHAEHDATAIAFRRLVYDALKKTENYVPSRDI